MCEILTDVKADLCGAISSGMEFENAFLKSRFSELKLKLNV